MRSNPAFEATFDKAAQAPQLYVKSRCHLLVPVAQAQSQFREGCFHRVEMMVG